MQIQTAWRSTDRVGTLVPQPRDKQIAFSSPPGCTQRAWPRRGGLGDTAPRSPQPPSGGTRARELRQPGKPPTLLLAPLRARARAPRLSPALQPGARAPAHQLLQLWQLVSRETPIRRSLSVARREPGQLREDSDCWPALAGLVMPSGGPAASATATAWPSHFCSQSQPNVCSAQRPHQAP